MYCEKYNIQVLCEYYGFMTHVTQYLRTVAIMQWDLQPNVN